MSVVVPKGGWTEGNLPEEFLLESAGETCWMTTESGKFYAHYGSELFVFDVRTILERLEMGLWKITNIIRPNKKENQMNENIKALHAVLKPFVRLKTRDGTLWIYHGVRNDKYARVVGEHHAYRGANYMSYPDNFLCSGNSGYDIIEVFDIPDMPNLMLTPYHCGKPLWKREEQDPYLASLEASLKQAQEALEAYKAQKQ